MTLGEGGDDRDQRGGLSGVALKTADLQREARAIDQQADHDLRIYSALLRIADLTQAVFVLDLEIQCRDVVEQQAQPTPIGGMREALGSDGIPVPAGVDLREVALNRLVRQRFCTQIGEHPQGNRPCWWVPRSARSPNPGTPHHRRHRTRPSRRCLRSRRRAIGSWSPRSGPGATGAPLGTPGANVSVPVRQSATSATRWARADTSKSRTS